VDSSPAGGRSHRDREFLPYGTTLLVAAITDAYLLVLQLGDGDVMCVKEDAAQADPLLPREPHLVADETDSLCMPGAQNRFRMGLYPLRNERPALILISSDGYFNSFAAPDDFRKVGPDLLAVLRSTSLEHVRRQLARWLDDVSRDGSGDDVTLGIICRRDLIGAAVPTAADDPDSSVLAGHEGGGPWAGSLGPAEDNPGV
jgi:hypothetical protein